MFDKIADKISVAAASGISFTLASLVVVVWAIVGPLFQFSDTWQLAINTPTTIVTFLLLFLVHNTVSRASLAQKVQLNELTLAIQKARNYTLDLDSKSLKELTAIQRQQIISAAKALQENN